MKNRGEIMIYLKKVASSGLSHDQRLAAINAMALLSLRDMLDDKLENIENELIAIRNEIEFMRRGGDG